MVQPRRDATYHSLTPPRAWGPTAYECAHAAATARRAGPRWRPGRRSLAVLLAVVGLAAFTPSAWDRLGSAWYADAAQHRLAARFAQTLVEHPSLGLGLAPSATAPSAAAPVPTVPAGAPRPAAPTADPRVAPIARLTIPAIGLDAVVVGGNSPAQLRQGPGWMPGSAPLGTPGNAVVSGHRTTYGAPFRHLDALRPGDRITVQRPGHADDVYELRATLVVAPGDVWVARTTDGVRLTLTTCHPAGSDRQRLVLQAELVAGEALGAATPAARWTPSAP